MPDEVGWLHGVAAGLVALPALHVCLGWRGGARGAMLAVWMALTALWALAAVVSAWAPGWPRGLALALDSGRAVAAVGLMVAWLGGLRAAPRIAIVAAVLGLTAWAVPLVAPSQVRLLAQANLSLAVLGLVAVEAFWRALPRGARWAAKPLCLALGAGCAFEVYAWGEVALLGGATSDVWVARVGVAVLCMPMAWLFAARACEGRVAVTLSRRAALQSTALVACGGYVLLMSAAGFYVRDFGGRWGPALQVLLLFAGGLMLVVLVSSASVRARVRLALARHFFKLRYDYRHTWLGLTGALSAAVSFEDSARRVVRALADLVESPGGVLWWADEAGDFQPQVADGASRPRAIEPKDSAALAAFAHGVVVLGVTTPAMRPAVVAQLPCAWLAVPLTRGGAVKGFVVLRAPRTAVEVNWEVRDVLLTVAQQAVSDLTHWQALEALLAARRFEAVSRMATFAVHDLKNCVAELTFLVANTRRHGASPAFQKDMMTTLEHVVGRMRSLIESFKQDAQAAPETDIDLAALLRALGSELKAARPQPTIDIKARPRVRADATRLHRVIGHLLQNAIDATDALGRVWVNLTRCGDDALIEIQDTGHGMSEDFVRNRLFKPFQTTKSQGMGIGAFEAQQYIRALGGRVEVDSAPGRGTRFEVRLPAVASSAQVAA